MMMRRALLTMSRSVLLVMLGCFSSVQEDGAGISGDAPDMSATSRCSPALPVVRVPRSLVACTEVSVGSWASVEGRCGSSSGSWRFLWIDRGAADAEPLSVRIQLPAPGVEYGVGWADDGCQAECIERGRFLTSESDGVSLGSSHGFRASGALSFSADVETLWLCPSGARP